MSAAPDLSGRAVVVTGAAGRLGRDVVAALAAAGARVAALDLAVPAHLPGAAVAAACDATHEASVSDAFARAEAALGAPDAVVHTVGAWGGAPLADTPLADWRAVLDVNLTSTFLVFREAVRRMPGGGRLVAIASGQGADRGVAEQAAYSAAKAGVVRLVEAVTAEHAARGLTAVAVAPSTILYDGDAGPGVASHDVAALCARLCGPDGGVHAGATLRAYGA